MKVTKLNRNETYEDDNDSYDEFVQKATSNPISKAVKIADITDNLDLSRISKMTDKDAIRVIKYQRVLKILNEKLI